MFGPSRVLFLASMFLAALAVSSGCSKAHKPDAVVLQGAWKGQEAAGNAAGSDSLVLSGTNLEFHGADPREWYKASVLLRSACVAAKSRTPVGFQRCRVAGRRKLVGSKSV
jgi:hypothetical protein